MRVTAALPHLSLSPLAAAFALSFALDASRVSAESAPPRSPQSIVVQNCGDSGPGSFRQAIDDAVDGDTIDASQLQCSTITLSTGALLIGDADITLHGPGNHQLTLSGAGDGDAAIVYDLGGGTLRIDGIDFTLGAKYRPDSSAHGGCIYTNGDLVLDDSRVSFCSVHAASYTASGGAIYAYGTATITHSDIYFNSNTTSGIARGGCIAAHGGVTLAYSRVSECTNSTLFQGFGGGVFSGGPLVMKYSSISDSDNGSAETGLGGGVYVRGDATVLMSTISGNHASVGGGIDLMDDGNGASASIGQSTISGNTAHAAGGISTSMPLTLYNSTVAFNTTSVGNSTPIGYAFGSGLGVRSDGVTISSSILARNVIHHEDGSEEIVDIGGDLPIPIGGSNDLVMASEEPVPGDTIPDDPLLAPLADNGGATKTHALAGGSPALDRGLPGNWATDQRGPGFPRVLNGVADIGAFERDPDVIFINGFD
jgi:hypothetical protein